MNSPHKIRGLYAVTPDEPDTALLIQKVTAALQGGVSLLQYRNKAANHKLKTQQARALLPLCRQYGVPLIINDSVKLCLTLDADGVHLGAEDGDLKEARARLGAGKILGASCYNRIDLATQAQSAGADYVAFGACFGSNTKPNARHAPLSLFKEARQHIHVPMVAIGGITLENAQQVLQAGADAIAVVNALFNAKNITETSQQLSRYFPRENFDALRAL